MRPVRLAAVLLTAGILAASPAPAGRPLETEDAETLAPGDFELEVSGDYVRNPDEDVWTGKGVLNAGVFPRFEAKLEVPIVLLDPDGSASRGGLGDALVGVKYRFIDERVTVPALLGALTARMPTGDHRRGLGAEEVDVTALGVIGKTIGSFVVHGNVGYTFVAANRHFDTWTLAASTEYRVTPTLWVVGEALGFLFSHGDPQASGRFRAGVVYALHRNIKLDGAVGHGFTRESRGALITVGMTIGF